MKRVKTTLTLWGVFVGVLGAGLCPAADVPPQPKSVTAFHRSGQTFLTWTERADLRGEQYCVYRHGEPITAANLAKAKRLARVGEGSGLFFADRYNHEGSGTWRARYVDRFVIQDKAKPLPPGVGLLVWTVAAEDFGGRESGKGYYAVTTVASGGAENVRHLGPGNTTGPVAERVEDPLPVEIAHKGKPLAHAFIQYMDLRAWNPTFCAPREGNYYFGLKADSPGVPNALQYAWAYTVGEPDPANHGRKVPAKLPVILYLHGWDDDTYKPQLTASRWYCALEVRPIDTHQTWFFGFARKHDYRKAAQPPKGDTIVNYTEQRMLRMVYDLLRHPKLGPRADRNRIYVYGHSMGGSGTLALALRYPNVFAAAYASEPMTNYRTSGDGGATNWRPDVEPKWGKVAWNLPVRIDGPGGWAKHLQRHNGTGVWDWQNHQANLTKRIADEIVPICLAHGLKDTAIEWKTQGLGTYAALNASARAWAGAVLDLDHTWTSFEGFLPSLGDLQGVGPFGGLKAVLNETVPGLSNASTNAPIPPKGVGRYNTTLEWSASWNPWDKAPIDTPTEWRISLRATDGKATTVDVTPRRCRKFRPRPGARYRWENRRVGDDGLTAGGVVTADRHGLVTVRKFAVSGSGSRLVLRAAAP
jgi:pimeloyl-ACP methyl ester carboxylesterase